MLLCIVLHNAPALQNDPNMILEKRNVENPLFRDFVDGERTKNKRQATILSSARLAWGGCGSVADPDTESR